MLATFTKREVQNAVRDYGVTATIEAVVAGVREAKADFVVYEVYQSAWDGRAFLGLFSTREKAQAFIQRCEDASDHYAREYSVQERKVDEF